MKPVFPMLVLLAFTTFFFTACNNDKGTGATTEAADKKEPLATDERYTCTMHNEVMSSSPGHCSKCGMTLVKQKMTPAQQKLMQEGTYTKSKEEQ